jgi:alpha-tubulin suppressor-like RCC1 family protein
MTNKYIACGFSHSVAVKNEQSVVCWEDNRYNQCDPIHQTLTDIKTYEIFEYVCK